MRKMSLVILVLAASALSIFSAGYAADEKAAARKYAPNDYSKLLGSKGLSDTLLKNHFKLYEGYVNNVNSMMDKLSSMLAEGREKTPECSELRRRFGFEFDGMRLHEYFFECLGGDGKAAEDSALYKKITEKFGSFDNWKKDFVAAGMMRGIGWAVLYYDRQGDALVNVWIGSHETNNLSGAKAIVVLDTFEHAYVTDYQLDKAKYIEAFMANLDWKAIGARFDEK